MFLLLINTIFVPNLKIYIMSALSNLQNKGFNLNQSLTIIKRINKHISYCISKEQNYDETIFFIEQDFSFERNFLESLVCDCILTNVEVEKYYDSRC